MSYFISFVDRDWCLAGGDCTGTREGVGLIQLLPALCHKDDDIADIGLNVLSDKGLDALYVLFELPEKRWLITGKNLLKD